MIAYIIVEADCAEELIIAVNELIGDNQYWKPAGSHQIIRVDDKGAKPWKNSPFVYSQSMYREC